MGSYTSISKTDSRLKFHVSFRLSPIVSTTVMLSYRMPYPESGQFAVWSKVMPSKSKLHGECAPLSTIGVDVDSAGKIPEPGSRPPACVGSLRAATFFSVLRKRSIVKPAVQLLDSSSLRKSMYSSSWRRACRRCKELADIERSK